MKKYIEAQEEMYKIALKEIKAGRKESHWVWFIFPQFAGLGFSYESYYYGIKSINEAKEYYNNEYLRNHLIEITQALYELNIDNLDNVLSITDYYKVRSSMTLFYYVSKNELFKKVVDKYYNGEFDKLTLKIIELFPEPKIISTTGDLEIIHKIWEDSLNEVKYHIYEESN